MLHLFLGLVVAMMGTTTTSGFVAVVGSPRLKSHRLSASPDQLVALVQQEAPGISGEIACLQAGTSLFASVFGFGDAILAMPLLALVFGLDATEAAPLVVCVSTLMIAGNLAVDFRSGKMESVGRWTESAGLLAGAVVGVPIGVNALISLDPELLRASVGVLLILYAARQLSAEDDSSSSDAASADATNPFYAVPFGFASGLLGGAVAEPGPPAVVFGQTRRWDPETMRVMLFRFFLPVQLISLFDFHDAGLLTNHVLAQAAAAVPGVCAAVAVGTVLNRKIDPDLFRSIVATIVLGLGFLCCSSAAPHISTLLTAAEPTLLTSATTENDALPVVAAITSVSSSSS